MPTLMAFHHINVLAGGATGGGAAEPLTDWREGHPTSRPPFLRGWFTVRRSDFHPIYPGGGGGHVPARVLLNSFVSSISSSLSTRTSKVHCPKQVVGIGMSTFVCVPAERAGIWDITFPVVPTLATALDCEASPRPSLRTVTRITRSLPAAADVCGTQVALSGTMSARARPLSEESVPHHSSSARVSAQRAGWSAQS